MVDPFEGQLGVVSDDKLLRRIADFRTSLKLFAPKDPGKLTAAGDILAEMIDEAKRRGLKVSA